MKRPSVVAGIGALAFGILTFIGLALINPPGGTYKAHDVDKYLKHSHHVQVFLGLYLEVIAALGLIVLLAYLRDLVAGAQVRLWSWTIG